MCTTRSRQIQGVQTRRRAFDVSCEFLFVISRFHTAYMPTDSPPGSVHFSYNSESLLSLLLTLSIFTSIKTILRLVCSLERWHGLALSLI
jgi:hypothetical protein